MITVTSFYTRSLPNLQWNEWFSRSEIFCDFLCCVVQRKWKNWQGWGILVEIERGETLGQRLSSKCHPCLPSCHSMSTKKGTKKIKCSRSDGCLIVSLYQWQNLNVCLWHPYKRFVRGCFGQKISPKNAYSATFTYLRQKCENGLNGIKPMKSNSFSNFTIY